jgi:LacI family transcriptional regulator
VDGYAHALAENGFSGNEQIFFGLFNQQSGYQITLQAMQSNPVPTAFFGANNFISIGILQALRESGLHVPADISVVGFDDLPPAMQVDPILSVASQPAYEMGQRGTELLLERISDETIEGFRTLVLPTEIILRRSTQTLPTGIQQQ